MIIKTSYSFMKPPPSARLIQGHRLAQSLAGYWSFGENGGLLVFDLSENRNTGIRYGTGNIWTSGKFGSAQEFNGTDDLVEISDSPSLSITGSLTIIVYLNPTITLEGAMKQRFVNKPDDYGFSFNQDLEFFYRNSAGDVRNFRVSGSLPAGNWYHLASVWDGDKVTLYKDSIVIGVGDLANEAIRTTGNPLRIGMWTGTTQPFDGQIDHVLIYNRALSASEIAELYARPFCMFERKARTALMSGYEVVAPPVGMAAYYYRHLLQGVA